MRTDAIQQANPQPAHTPDQKLKRACQQFEGLFLSQLMRSMRKTVTTTDLFGSEKSEQTFRDMLDSEMCDAATRTQSVGIADMLYRQLRTGLRPTESKENTTRGGQP
jgi:flagellar protein FlgJ